MNQPFLTPEQIWLLSACVLAAILGLTALWLLRVYRRTHYTIPQIPLYALNWYLTRVQWRTEVYGAENFPQNQGAILVSNHIGPIDPAFIALLTNRPVHWLVAKEYFGYPVFGQVLRTLQAIPTSRAGVDTAATKLAMRHVSEGDLVGLFPEGKINNTSELLLPGRAGAALIALRTKAPVIPCYLKDTPYDGTSWGFLFMRAHAKLTVGKPLDFSEFHGRAGEDGVLEEVTLRMLRAIATLAGQPDYPVTLAERRRKPPAARFVLPEIEGGAEALPRETTPSH